MKYSMLLAALVLVSSVVKADDVFVVDSHRNIPLADDEAVYKDFYLNGGTDDGFKKNLVVTAVRRLAIKDSTGAHSYGEIEVPVGQLRVLAVFNKVTVAREYKLLSRDDFPMLEQTGVMSGDRIELKGAFTDDKPLKKKVLQAAAETPAVPGVLVAVAPAPTPTPMPTAVTTPSVASAPVATPTPVATTASQPAPVTEAPRAAASVVTLTPPKIETPAAVAAPVANATPTEP